MRGSAPKAKWLLDGENILAQQQDAALLRARIGMVFQTPTPFPMSIYQNVAFGIGLYRTLPQGELDAEVERALRRAALWDEVKDHLAQDGLSLSGGQQQRLCIARAIAIQPDVLLLDEPCSAIDPLSSAKIEETIDELKQDHTIVIVTHNLQQAARVQTLPASCISASWSSSTPRSICSSRRRIRARSNSSPAASASA